jgi:hypothetical protein
MSLGSWVRAPQSAVGVEFHPKKLNNVLMPEWSKGPDSSSGVATRVGSNPTQDNLNGGTEIETRGLQSAPIV